MDSGEYRQFLDLTASAQRQQRERKASLQFLEPVPALSSATSESLPDSVRAAFESGGWTNLMPVQARAIPYMLDGRDLIVQSRTGSGKTGAFLLPLFETLRVAEAVTQALILTPTRELARQIHAEFERLSAGTSLCGVAIYGGVGYKHQIERLSAGTQVVVGTPGRILDHLYRRTFSLDGLRAFVLDEADEMLSMGFYPAMRKLKEFLPEVRQSCMFSATMPAKVRSLGQEFLREPTFLGLSSEGIGVETIEHGYYRVARMEKDRALIRLIELENPDSAIVFANTKREVEYLHQFIRNYGYDAAEITGNLPQHRRELAMERLRQGSLRILVATDVAARGIDISDLSHVFQYDVPLDPEYYIHRTGRTARAGRAGTALTLSTIEEERSLLSIASRYDIDLEKRQMPNESDVARRVAERMVVVLEEQLRARTNLERERLQRFIPVIEDLVREQPELLAMLVDDLYHKRMHQGTDKQPPSTSRRSR